MSKFVIVTAADGCTPGEHSLISFAAVRLDRELSTSFYGRVAPTSPFFGSSVLSSPSSPLRVRHDELALARMGLTRSDHENFPPPDIVMPRFRDWVRDVARGDKDARPIFLSEEPVDDWAWLHYAMDEGGVPDFFGASKHRIGDFYCGLTREWCQAGEAKWKNGRPIASHPLEEALSIARDLQRICEKFGVMGWMD